MRPIDFCHPNELCAPAPRAFPARARSFRCGDAPRSLRLRQALPGDRTFHDVRDRFGGSSMNTNLARRCLTAFRHERGRCLPTVLNAIEPLAPLSRPSGSTLRLLHFRGGCSFATRPPFERVRAGRRMRRSPRPPLTPSREKPTPRDDPGYLPSIGTLRRIRWPLQPRSREPRTAFGDVGTAG